MSDLRPGEGAAGILGGRRSARLRSQIHASDEGAVLARPRSASLRPQIDANQHGAGVASRRRSSKGRSTQIQASEGGDRVTRRCRGKRLRPQTHASEVGDGMSRRRRGTSPEPPASPLEVDDLLREILLRLPLDLHSLTRASAVCKRWRGIVVDHKFVDRFYARHRKPPLLGFFPRDERTMFTPVLAPATDRILPGSFDLGRRYSNSEVSEVLDSRHGRVLLTSWVIVDGWVREEVVVCDPITSKQQQHRVSIPLGLKGIGGLVNGAVFCAAATHDHVHGSCRSCPFKVVLLSYRNYKHPYACVYSSETDTWGNVISTEAPHDTPFGVCPSTLIGNALCWPAKHKGDSILQFDLGTQNLAIIKGPPGMNMNDFDNFHIIQAEDGAVGLAALSHLELQMWERKVDCQGVAIWLLQKTVSLRKLLKVPPRTERSYESLKVVGYDEDNNVILLARHDGVYMVQPKSMQARKLNGTGSTHYCYTFTSFYPLGTTIDGGTNGAENVRMALV